VADWRESGCSMCLGMNGDTVGPGQYAVSTSNRNFEGRQGVGARTLLVSPLTRPRAPSRADHRSEGAGLMEHCKRAFEDGGDNVQQHRHDQIIPARFLTTTTKEGLGRQAFADWRYLATAAPIPTSC